MTSNLAFNVQGEGPLWLWIHGWGMNKSVWEPILPTFTQSHRVITVDLPGFGESGWHSDYAKFEAAVDQLEALTLNLHAEHNNTDIHLLGWSMGGLFATALASRQPELFAHLTWVASTAKFMHEDNWKGIQPNVLAMFQKQLKQDFRATTERFLAVQAMGSPSAKKDIQKLKAILQSTAQPHPEALAAGLEWLSQIDLRNEFEGLSIPSTRIYGSKDSLVPKQQRDAFNKAQDQSFMFENSAHTPFLNEQEQFLEVLNNIAHQR